MAITDSQGLSDIGSCYQCAGDTTIFQMMKLALLKQISESINPSNDTTPSGLMEQGKCYQCGANLSSAQTMEIALLVQIAS